MFHVAAVDVINVMADGEFFDDWDHPASVLAKTSFTLQKWGVREVESGMRPRTGGKKCVR